MKEELHIILHRVKNLLVYRLGLWQILEGLKAILIEKDAKYCDVIRRRVEKYECQQPGSLFRKEMALC